MKLKKNYNQALEYNLKYYKIILKELGKNNSEVSMTKDHIKNCFEHSNIKDIDFEIWLNKVLFENSNYLLINVLG